MPEPSLPATDRRFLIELIGIYANSRSFILLDEFHVSKGQTVGANAYFVSWHQPYPPSDTPAVDKGAVHAASISERGAAGATVMGQGSMVPGNHRVIELDSVVRRAPNGHNGRSSQRHLLRRGLRALIERHAAPSVKAEGDEGACGIADAEDGPVSERLLGDALPLIPDAIEAVGIHQHRPALLLDNLRVVRRDDLRGDDNVVVQRAPNGHPGSGEWIALPPFIASIMNDDFQRLV